MGIDKSFLTGSTGMLILSLLNEQDMYGYQMIECLARRSNNTFAFKAGTLYPLLKSMENQGLIHSYEDSGAGERVRKYYTITTSGRGQLSEKQEQWATFSSTINQIMEGGKKIELV